MNDEREWRIAPGGGARRIAGHDDPFAFAEWLSSRARGVLQRDGEHASMVFFHELSGGWVVHLIGFSDLAGKTRLWEELASIVSDAGYDAFVFVGEALSAPGAEAGPSRDDPARSIAPRLTDGHGWDPSGSSEAGL
jgi:hypothetical protein